MPALAGLAVVVTIASGGPAHAPELTAAPARTGVAAARPQPKPKPAPAKPAPATPRICFASMQDARAAAESAAIPEGAVVQERSDGRVCVRGG